MRSSAKTKESNGGERKLRKGGKSLGQPSEEEGTLRIQVMLEVIHLFWTQTHSWRTVSSSTQQPDVRTERSGGWLDPGLEYYRRTRGKRIEGNTEGVIQAVDRASRLAMERQASRELKDWWEMEWGYRTWKRTWSDQSVGSLGTSTLLEGRTAVVKYSML